VLPIVPGEPQGGDGTRGLYKGPAFSTMNQRDTKAWGREGELGGGGCQPGCKSAAQYNQKVIEKKKAQVQGDRAFMKEPENDEAKPHWAPEERIRNSKWSYRVCHWGISRGHPLP